MMMLLWEAEAEARETGHDDDVGLRDDTARAVEEVE
jgi:hypothetical protein